MSGCNLIERWMVELPIVHLTVSLYVAVILWNNERDSYNFKFT